MTARPFSPETLGTHWGCSSDIAARVASYIEPRGDDDCWLWNGPVLRSGYGNAGSWFHNNVGTVLVHRLMYLAANGELPKRPLVVRHTCDTRLCCNPRHLIPGTPLENMRDMVVRGRSTKGKASLGYGERHPRSKLTDSAVASIFEMHASGLSHRKIGTKVGVSGAQVGRILRRESRAHETV